MQHRRNLATLMGCLIVLALADFDDYTCPYTEAVSDVDTDCCAYHGRWVAAGPIGYCHPPDAS